ncbi:MAG: hypothetical protein OEO23_00845 [Gemmatimonadota bacterium]|nr:hypothetical protein [Gemmatimonadota bacterium]
MNTSEDPRNRISHPNPPVALPTQVPRLRATTAALVAGAGHAGTFLALGAGSLWLAVRGMDALPAVQRLFVGGLYMQVLPAIGFAVVARHLSRFGRSQGAIAAGALSLVSLMLMGVGTLQTLGGGSGQSFLLALSLVLVTAIGVGVVSTRLGHVMKDQFESEPVLVQDTQRRTPGASA